MLHAFMGALATHLSSLDRVQKLAGILCGCVFPALQSHCATSTTGFLCKLLDFLGCGPLQLFCPAFVTPATHTYQLRSLTNDCSSIQFNREVLLLMFELLFLWNSERGELRGVTNYLKSCTPALKFCLKYKKSLNLKSYRNKPYKTRSHGKEAKQNQSCMKVAK